MAVLSKRLIDQKTAELEQYYADLKKLLSGKTVDIRMGRHYVPRRELVNELRDIDIDKILTAIGHFRVALDALARLKSQALKPTNSPQFHTEEIEPF